MKKIILIVLGFIAIVAQAQIHYCPATIPAEVVSDLHQQTTVLMDDWTYYVTNMLHRSLTANYTLKQVQLGQITFPDNTQQPGMECVYQDSSMNSIYAFRRGYYFAATPNDPHWQKMDNGLGLECNVSRGFFFRSQPCGFRHLMQWP